MIPLESFLGDLSRSLKVIGNRTFRWENTRLPINFPYTNYASGCVVECRICNREVTCSNLGRGYFAPRFTQPSIPTGSVNEYQLRLGRQRQVWLIPIADERVVVQVKLWNPLRTRAIPERFCGGDSLRRGAISSVCTFTTTTLVMCRVQGPSASEAAGGGRRAYKSRKRLGKYFSSVYHSRNFSNPQVTAKSGLQVTKHGAAFVVWFNRSIFRWSFQVRPGPASPGRSMSAALLSVCAFHADDSYQAGEQRNPCHTFFS